MAVETVLLALLGVVAVWLAFDAGRERHRLRARMERATVRATRAGTSGRVRGDAVATPVSPRGEAWRYWPLTVSTSEDGSVGPRL